MYHKLIITLLLFCSISYGQSASTMLLLMDDIWDNLPQDYGAFKLTDGGYLKTSDGEIFTVEDEEQYVFATFNYSVIPRTVYPSDEDLYISYSIDGTEKWTTPVLAHNPDWSLRDPSITYYNNKYFIAYTRNAFGTGSYLNPITTFGLLSSTNLTSWTEMDSVDMSSITNVKRVWAPEFYVENEDIYVIVSCTDQVNSSNVASALQLYIVKALNNNLTDWSTPTKITITGRTNVIDGYVLKVAGVYNLFYKNEDTKYIELATSNSLYGDYTVQETGNWAGWAGATDWIEGCCIIKDRNTYKMYFDNYSTNNGGAVGKLMRISESKDLENWYPPRDFNINYKHGTIIRRTQ